MIILSIETSCDETAVSIVHAESGAKSGTKSEKESPHFDVLANLVLSQIKTHAQYGGVFPAIARREHSLAIAPLIEQALVEAKIEKTAVQTTKMNGNVATQTRAREILHRDPDLAEKIITLVEKFPRPKIDMLAVTYGPGLEPALWIGLTVAQTLSTIWNIPLMPINHMEGHIVSVLYGANQNHAIKSVQFPALALLISGGHTELVLVKDWTEYEIIGETRDDAVGEAFDKVARMLGLPYPGGPEISRLAAEWREQRASGTNGPTENPFHFPRPMMNTADFDFSFSGLKTSILYTLKKLPRLTPEIISQVAEEFENAVTEVLLKKTLRAAEVHGAKSLIIAGGVAANKFIRKSFEEATAEKNIALFVPENNLSTDNALMIAICAYMRNLYGKTGDLQNNLLEKEIRAVGNARLGE
ncbi:MAG: tRNA (adenosine(37)-N6)-threonylcarbamoyltransferase complex transferase subunit TsaD [Patescibacteria group bacterium]